MGRPQLILLNSGIPLYFVEPECADRRRSAAASFAAPKAKSPRDGGCNRFSDSGFLGPAAHPKFRRLGVARLERRRTSYKLVDVDTDKGLWRLFHGGSLGPRAQCPGSLGPLPLVLLLSPIARLLCKFAWSRSSRARLLRDFVVNRGVLPRSRPFFAKGPNA